MPREGWWGMIRGRRWGNQWGKMLLWGAVVSSLGCGAPEKESPDDPALAAPRPRVEPVVEPLLEPARERAPRDAAADWPTETSGRAVPRSIDYSDPEALVDLIDDLSVAGGPESMAQLEEILATAPDEEIRMDVIDAAAFLADEQDVSTLLVQAIDDPSPLVRIEAADLAAEMSLVEVLPILRRRAAVESDPEAQIVLDQAVDELEWQDELPVR